MRLIAVVFAFCTVLLSGCASLQTQEATHASNGLSPVTKGHIGSTGVAPLNLPNDLWERIRKGYQMPDLENDLATDRTQWYASKPDYLLVLPWHFRDNFLDNPAYAGQQLVFPLPSLEIVRT